MPAKTRKPKPERVDPCAIHLEDFVYQKSGQLEAVVEMLSGVSDEGWLFLNDHSPDKAQRLLSISQDLARLLNAKVSVTSIMSTEFVSCN